MFGLTYTDQRVIQGLGTVFMSFGRNYLTGLMIPGIFATAYAHLFPVLYFSAPGGYGSLPDVLTLLNSDPRIGLAAWLHSLAFDLLIGKRIVNKARRIGLAHLAVVPALFLCFMFNSIGWAVFQVQRVLHGHPSHPTGS